MAGSRVGRTPKIILAILLVVVAGGITFSYVVRSSTAKADRTPHVYDSSQLARSGSNFVELDANIVNITPSAPSTEVVVTVIPHGTYAEDPDTLAVPMNLEMDGVQGGHVSFEKGQSPEPVDANLDLAGDLSQYPFDSYSSRLSMQMTGASSGPAGSGTKLRNVIPIRIIITSNLHDWKVNPTLTEANLDGTVDINLSAGRGVANLGFALFELLIMVAIAAIAIAMTYSSVVGIHELNWALFGWFGAMLFALPAIRNTMPGVPGVGTVSDYTIYFWCLFVVGSCLFVTAFVYLKRTLSEHKSGSEGSTPS